VLVSASVVHGHHSYAGFYKPEERTVAIEGALEEFQYANPHVILTIRTADSSLFTVTWQSSLQLTRQANLTKETFKVGDHLVVIAAPSRDPNSREVTMVREIRRPPDQWVWRASQPFAAPR
jgi:hypothetical protein